ncbi:MAG TPA: alpha/beta fold hydrolase [Nocardioidaceae bacterium]|nr:alpha/beta fold hydrolase [Nocardioidaceae bacterium]
MATTFTLLPSPLLGPAAWEPVRDVLRARGHRVVVADVPVRPSGPDDVLARLRAAVPPDGDVVLVPHSNAGLYAPALAGQVLTAPERRIATVYVDAALPSSTPTTPLAPAGLLAHLTGLAGDDGWLPPWTAWWDDAEVDRLFPSTTWRRRVEEAQPRLPLAYFRSRVGVPAGWATRPSAYLSFGDTYEREVTEARSLDWPVAVLDGGHLHMLHDPEAVASAVLGLLEQLARRTPSAGGSSA